MSDTPWGIAQAVAQRNGLDPLVLYTHANAHHDGNPIGPDWTAQCEAAAACLHGHDPAQWLIAEVDRAAAEVTDRVLRPALADAGLDPTQHSLRFDTTPLLTDELRPLRDAAVRSLARGLDIQPEILGGGQ